MKTMSRLLVVAGFAGLVACGTNEEANNLDANMTDLNADLNAMPADNLTVDANNVTVIDNGADAAGMNSADINTGDTNATANGY